MGFEEFKREKGWKLRKNVIITRHGVLSLSEKFHKKYSSYAVLLYNREERLIGVKPCEMKKENSYKLSGELSALRRSISLGSFLRHYGIPYEKKSISYSSYWCEDSQMLVVDLKKEE